MQSTVWELPIPLHQLEGVIKVPSIHPERDIMCTEFHNDQQFVCLSHLKQVNMLAGEESQD